MRAKERNFKTADTGSATIEFLIWLPVLTVWMLFSSAIFIAWDNRSVTAKAAYAISDMLSRRETVDAAFLAQIRDLNVKLTGRASADSRMRMSSITESGAGLAVQWSCGDVDLPPLTDAEIPAAIIPTMAPLDTIILTETYVRYTPISTIGGLTTLDWVNELVTRPRIVRDVSLVGGCE